MGSDQVVLRWHHEKKNTTGSILSAGHFEDEARRLADFQNKHKQWVPQGGVVKCLTMDKL